MSIKRCSWCLKHPMYIDYHDNEWGVPVHNDQKLFEFLCLEGAQAGLSWWTVLQKRAHYRKVYDEFDIKKVAQQDDQKRAALLADPGIIRNKLKVNAFIVNARKTLEIQEAYGSFDHYLWQFVNHQPLQNQFADLSEVPATSPESDALSKDLKKHGFKFVGSTICYAFMQACGMVNDHVTDCFRHAELSNT